MSRSSLVFILLLCSVAIPAPVAAQTCVFDGCATNPCKGGCSPQDNRFLSTQNFSYSPSNGAFDLRGTDYELTCANPTACATVDIPPLRFWAYNEFTVANLGCQSLWIPPPVGDAFIANGGLDIGLPAGMIGVWLLYQAQWASGPAGFDVTDGCITTDATIQPGDTSLRTVVEMSWEDSTTGAGTRDHGSYYLVASVPETLGTFPFDDIRGGNGGFEARLKPELVPAIIDLPPPVGGITCPDNGITVEYPRNVVDRDFYDVEVMASSSTPLYFTEVGRNSGQQLIAGLQVVYAAGGAPTSSDPAIADWRPSRDPADPVVNIAGIVPMWSTFPVTVSLPTATAPHWVAVRIVYQDDSVNPTLGPGPDATAPVLVSLTGSHCGPTIYSGAPLKLLRNDKIRSLKPPMNPPLADFLPLDPALDLYDPAFNLGDVDPDTTVLDGDRPLIFYQFDRDRPMYCTCTPDGMIRFD